MLIVDDLPANLVALEALVEELGYQAVLANSGSEALKRMLDAEFACVIMDLRMPGIDGLETAALIRKRARHKDIPLIFITSSEPTLIELSQGYSLGAVDFVIRPLDSEILKAKIRAVAQLHVERDLARREKEEELRKGGERLALLFDQLPIGLWSTDEYLKMTFCGGSLYGRGQYSRPESLVGRPIRDLFPSLEAGEPPALTAHREALLGQAQTYTEVRSGRILDCWLRPLKDGGGRVTGVLGAAVDVTDRRRSEEALRDGKEQFELLMKGVKDCAIIFLDPKGRVESWNAGAEAILGYSAAEAVGMPNEQFFLPENRGANGKAKNNLEEAVRSGSVRDEGWRLRKDGMKFWAEILLTALRRPDGSLRGYAKITRDLTERHEADIKLAQLKDNLEKLVRERTLALQESVEELEAFNCTVAHDVRTPLRTIVNLGQVLREDYRGKPLDGLGESYLNGMMDAARRMDELTQNLLTYSRVSKQTLAIDAPDLAPILKETLSEMAGDLVARGAVVETEPLPFPLRANRHLAKHVLSNLLQNAVKFVGPAVRPRVRVAGEPRGEFIRIWIEDNGIGVAKEDRARIFGIFERLHSQDAYPGTGLGLAIVKRSVERMGGRVGVDENPTGGCRFWFELPRA